jgi:magnesium transporter
MKEKNTEETRILSPEERIPEINSLLKMIDGKRYSDFKGTLAYIPSADIAELFCGVPKEYYAPFYRLLPKETAAEVFVEMDKEMREHIINSFTDRELSATLDELYLDDTVDIIEEMPATVVKRIIKASSEENREIINKLLKYPKDSAGSIMTTEYVRLKRDMTVREALEHIRHVAIDKETIYTCYVTDAKRHLIGIITARELLLSPLDTRLEDLMEETVVFTNTTDDKEDAVRKFDKYGFLALPVVDNESRLVGIITVDDAIGVIKEETEEDFAKMAAITPTETSYLKTGVVSIWRARIPWLLLLMISATLSSTILTRFESVLPAVLLLFVPMLMDTGGNCGSQSSVTVIRAISVGEARFSDLPKILWKEARVGALCGITLGIVAFIKVVFIDGMIMRNGAVTPFVALSVAASVCLTIITAKFIGSLLPMLAKKAGLDPAVMASPFITTLVDAVSLILYFFISALLLSA